MILIYLFNALSILVAIGLTASAFWFIFAVGVPLRRWLLRELADESPDSGVLLPPKR